MGYINVFIANPARISVKINQQNEDGDQKHSFPIEDLNVIMIESAQCTVSTYALKELTEHGIVVYLCDNQHIPCGILLPFNSHNRQTQMLIKQIEMGKPLKKQMWQNIVKQKIYNQAECVKLATGEICDELYNMSKGVLSDDADNREAVAASFYFKRLFEDNFTRTQDNFANACLNYGYTILRGMIARALVVAGLNPNLGLHHRNMLNNFNLADDLIEPFRPYVDLMVYNILEEGANDFTQSVKRKMFSLTNISIEIDKKQQPINYAIEIMMDSVVRSIKLGKECLVMPNMTKITMHEYE